MQKIANVEITMPPLVFDRQSSRAVDRAAASRFGMPTILLMENAAIALRNEALQMLGTREAGPVLLICGSGNNGGDGYALARHLHNAGWDVEILALGQPRNGTDARINMEVCARMNLPMVGQRDQLAHDPLTYGLVVDAIFGTGLDRPIEPDSVHWRNIEWINSLGRPVLSADIPSGLDCDTGQPLGIAVRATRTVSFLGIKRGFAANPEAHHYTGEVVVGDIGVPRELIEEFGIPR